MLEVHGLQVCYGAIQAVRQVDLEVQQGELVTLLGANGAGKSTTLLSIAGALKSSGGRVCFEGEDITGISPEQIVRRGLVMVPETRDVFADLTVKENLRLGAYIRRHDLVGFRKDIEWIEELFPILINREEQAAGTLSGGEQQMLVIARALMSRPRLLLLDEPSLGLAPTIVEQIFRMIEKLRQSGLTILLVEQNASQALRSADRAYVLSLGTVAAAGRAEDIASSSDLRAIYLGA